MRVPSAWGHQALPDPCGPSTPGPSIRARPGYPSCWAGGSPPHQYPPQSWGNTYPLWQPPAPHHPKKTAAATADPNPAAAACYSHHQQPQGPAPPPAGQLDDTEAWKGKSITKMGQQPQQPQQPGAGRHEGPGLQEASSRGRPRESERVRRRPAGLQRRLDRMPQTASRSLGMRPGTQPPAPRPGSSRLRESNERDLLHL